MYLHRLFLFLDTVVCKTMNQFPGCGVRVLFNQDADLVEAGETWSRACFCKDLEYANDMAFIADSIDAFKRFLQALDSCCTVMGLTSQRPFQKPRDVALRSDDGLQARMQILEWGKGGVFCP